MTDEVSRPVKLSIGTVGEWSPVTEGISVADLIDQSGSPDAQMTVGFARLAAGETMEISFPYDEVLVITKGAYTVTDADGSTISAEPGDVIYLPAGSENSSRADEDTEMVYVAAPPGVYAEHVAASSG